MPLPDVRAHGVRLRQPQGTPCLIVAALLRYSSSRNQTTPTGRLHERPMATTYGKWKIGDPLGEGGQSHVFAATDTTGEFDGTWVLKRLKNRDSMKRRGRFAQEAAAAEELHHQNIVGVVDFDAEGERPYIVSEYCERGTLADAKLNSYDLIQKLEVFLGICRGVGYAHKNGIVHRDLKPANIFLKADGTPVVGDFGLCFFLEDGTRFTATGEAVGAFRYMAPEVEGGRVAEVDARSDVYSLGKILYFILEGRVFSRENYRSPGYNLLDKHGGSDYAFIYELLDQSVREAPNDRFDNAAAFAEAVENTMRLIHVNAHHVSLDTPQECSYCRNGLYKPHVDLVTPNVTGRGHSQAKNEALNKVGHIYEYEDLLVLVCDNCGHLQWFAPFRAGDAPWRWCRDE